MPGLIINRCKLTNMSFEITGVLVKKYETETRGESFLTRDFVIKVNDGGKYDNFVKFQTTQDRTAIIDNHNEGDEIKVHFDLRGRQWQEKYFTNLNAWRVESVSQSQPKLKPISKPEAIVPETESGNDEELPF